MTKSSVETVNIENDTRFDDLIITGDYSYYYVLEEDQETIFLDYIV